MYLQSSQQYFSYLQSSRQYFIYFQSSQQCFNYLQSSQKYVSYFQSIQQLFSYFQSNQQYFCYFQSNQQYLSHFQSNSAVFQLFSVNPAVFHVSLVYIQTNVDVFNARDLFLDPLHILMPYHQRIERQVFILSICPLFHSFSFICQSFYQHTYILNTVINFQKLHPVFRSHQKEYSLSLGDRWCQWNMRSATIQILPNFVNQ